MWVTLQAHFSQSIKHFSTVPPHNILLLPLVTIFTTIRINSLIGRDLILHTSNIYNMIHYPLVIPRVYN